MRRAVFLVGIYSLLGCSTEKDPQPTVEPSKDFELAYKFRNLGDANVEAVFLESWTYFPRVDRSYSYYSRYIDITPFQEIRHISKDSSYAKHHVYPGCATYMSVILQFRHSVYTAFPSSNPYFDKADYRRREFELPAHVVEKAADGTVVFNWPSDTLKYHEKRYYY